MIEANEISFAYGREQLFNQLSLTMEPGNIYGLLGKNGAGKTTLLRILSGLTFPTSGAVSIMGENPALRKPELLSEIYFLAEDFHVPALRGDEYLRLYAPFYPKFDYQRFETILSEFQVDGRKTLTSLSYGQKKKFLLSFGIACNSTLLILDEPTNGLDIPSKSQFRKVAASSCSDDRIIIISTHQVRDMGHLIDPLLIVDAGSIILNRSLDQIGKHLSMRHCRTLPEGGSILFSEQAMGGYVVLEENQTGQESQLDIEVLFNAVMQSGDRIQELLERSVS
jgi:ABC-2 type transport system ATP-binding protein